MTSKEKFCLLAGFLKQDLFKDGCELFNPKTNELVSPKQLIDDIIEALEQHDEQAKILDILKNKLYLELSSDYLCLKRYKWQEADYTILSFDTQEEYDLLKEWLNDNQD